MLKDEVLESVRRGGEQLKQRLFNGLYIGEPQKEALLTSLCSGHHLLILGPPGCGKTAVAVAVSQVLGDIEVVEGCPLNCPPSSPSCPWCISARDRGVELRTEVVSGSSRVKRVQGSGELVSEDLIGALEPESALDQGLHSIAAFTPGKLLRANRGILLVDLIDRMPERALNTLLYALEGGPITIGAYEESLSLDILVIATGSGRVLESLPLGLLECFDVITLGYLEDRAQEKRLVMDNLERERRSEFAPAEVIDKAVEIAIRTRGRSEVERGVSTRGTLRYSELVSSLGEVGMGREEALLRRGATCSLPHRIDLAPHADLPGKREQVINEVIDEVLGRGREEEAAVFSKEDLLAVVEEICRDDRFRTPLKYGAFDLLLKRVQRFPDSKLSQMVAGMRNRLDELYPERFKEDNIDRELLQDIEEARRKAEAAARIVAELDAEALSETLEFLERQRVLERGVCGWEISRRGIALLLEGLTPKMASNYLYGYGKHATGKKLTVGEGRVVGTRHFRFGDRYRDVSLKDTIREALKNRRQSITRDDIMVTTKDIRAKMDLVLVIDLSGTMRQLEKLWYAKESAIALSLAAAQFKDRVGVVTFSNLAEVMVDITRSPHKLTKSVLDLELNENAFTNIGYGILKASHLFSHHRRGRASQHMIIISDGDATAPHPSPERYALRQATRAASKGITISCVCINEESTNPDLMRRIAKIGKGRTYFVGPEGLTTALLEERIVASLPS